MLKTSFEYLIFSYDFSDYKHITKWLNDLPLLRTPHFKFSAMNVFHFKDKF